MVAKGTDLYKRYKDIKCKISSTTQKLYRQRFDKAICSFHNSVDMIEMARQVNGNTTTEILTIPTVEFEIRERGTIAGMLSKPVGNNKARIKFIYTLARLCCRQETPQCKASKRNQPDFFIFKGDDTLIVSKREKTTDSFRNISNDSTITHIALDRKPSESPGETRIWHVRS